MIDTDDVLDGLKIQARREQVLARFKEAMCINEKLQLCLDDDSYPSRDSINV